jgi:hypothetical protein
MSENDLAQSPRVDKPFSEFSGVLAGPGRTLMTRAALAIRGVSREIVESLIRLKLVVPIKIGGRFAKEWFDVTAVQDGMIKAPGLLASLPKPKRRKPRK